MQDIALKTHENVALGSSTLQIPTIGNDATFVPLSEVRDIGPGSPIYCRVHITAGFTGGDVTTVIEFRAVVTDGGSFWVVGSESRLLAELQLGDEVIFPLGAMPDDVSTTAKSLAVLVIRTGTVPTGGSYDIDFTNTPAQALPRIYPASFNS